MKKPKNITISESAEAKARELEKLYDTSFSGLVTKLILEEHERRMAAEAEKSFGKRRPKVA